MKQFVQKLFHKPPMERQIDEIAYATEFFNFNPINFYNIGLNISNEYFSSDIKDLHKLIVQHMQYNYYQTLHKVIKQKDSCKFNCFLIVEGQVDIYDSKDEGTPIYSYKHGDVFTDREIMKTQKKQVIFVYHAHTHVGQTKYEDIKEVLEDSAVSQEEKDNKFLQNTHIFQKLNANYFKQAIPHLKFKEYNNGETVFLQNNSVDSFYIIKSGEFIIKKDVSIEKFSRKQSNEEGKSKEKELDQLLLSKKITKKTIQLRVMIEHEVFGEEQLIKEYLQYIKQNPNKQIQKELGSQLQRSYSVQCSSTNGILIIMSKEDLFKVILNKMKLYQVEDLVDRIDQKIKNIEYNVSKIKKSMKPYKQYFISESLLEDQMKQTPKSKQCRPSSGSFASTPRAHDSNQNNSNDMSISLSKKSLGEIINNSMTQDFKRQGIPSSKSINTSQILSNKIINDGFQDKFSLVQRKDSFNEPNFLSTNISQNVTPTNISLNRQRNKSASVRFFEQENSKQDQQENTPRNQLMKRTQMRPPSASLFSTMKKITSQNLKNTYINSFSQIDQQNENINQQQNVNLPFSRDSINETIREEISKIYHDDKSMMGRKRFSVFEKSTMETSFNVLSETIKSPRMKIQLGIQQNNNSGNHKSVDILSTKDKKLIKLENKLNNKSKDNTASKRISFIQFVPKVEANGQSDKVVSEKNRGSITYSGLNAKVLETVKRKVKIELIQPIFDRGYTENFKKEIVKINQKNTKFNYLVDVKEDNQAKGLDKFSLLQQIKDKQIKIKKISKQHQENTLNSNQFQINPSQFQINLSQQQINLSQLQINPNFSNNNSNLLLVQKDNIQNNSFQISESMIMGPLFQQQLSPRLNINTNSFINLSAITSPIVSPRPTSKSVQPSPKKNKNFKNTYEILSQIVEDKQTYPMKGFIGSSNIRPKSYSLKSPNNNPSILNSEQFINLQPRKSTNSVKQRSSMNIHKPSMMLIHKKTRLQSPSSQNSHILIA